MASESAAGAAQANGRGGVAGIGAADEGGRRGSSVANLPPMRWLLEQEERPLEALRPWRAFNSHC